MITILLFTDSAAVPLSLKTLSRLEWKEQGKVKTFCLVYEVSTRWQEFDTRLGQDPNLLKGWHKKHHGNGIKVWKEVMEHWLSSGGTEDYSATWEGLYSLLDDMKLSTVSAELKLAVSKCAKV